MKTKYSSLAATALTTMAMLSLMVSGALAAPAASPSELLEQGIYSEETKGDIDAALKLYQQAVAETKAGQAIGAQAQYRLGVCLYKKKNYADASAAFEKLIRDFPDEKDLIARARTYLAGAVTLLPAPWVDGEQMRMDLKMPGGKKFGFAQYTARSGELDGHKTWLLRTRIFAGVVQASRVQVEADSFKPLHSRWKHTLLGEADTTFRPSGADLKLVGREGTQHIDLKDVVYDNEEVVELIRRLPLATNYSTTLRVFTGLGGGNTIPIKVCVVGVEQVQVPAGTFDCYKIELQLGITQTFYYSTDEHHYLVKFEASGIMAELADITHTKPTTPVTWHEGGFSVTAPPDWCFYLMTQLDPKGTLLAFDPDAAGIAEVRVRSRESLKPDAKKSVRDWAEQLVVEKSEESKINVRPDSWQERKVAGQPAVSFIADGTADKEQKLIYAVCAFLQNQAVYFSVEITAKDFDTYRPGFEAIVDSFRLD